MPRYPSLPEEVALIPMPGEGCYALRGDEGYFLPDPSCGDLLPLVDGTRSYRELRARCATAEDARKFSALLRHLVRRKILEEWAFPLPAPVSESARLRAWQELLRDDRIRQAFPGGLYDLRGERTGNAPEELLPPQRDRTGPSLLLVDDLTDPRIEPFARLREERGESWILFQPDGLCPVIGPCFTPSTVRWPELVRARQGVAETLFLLRQKTGQTLFPPVRRRDDPALRLALLHRLLAYPEELDPASALLSLRTCPPPDFSVRLHHFPARPGPTEGCLAMPYAQALPFPCPLSHAVPWNRGRELSIAAVAARLSVFCDPYLGPVEKLDVLSLGDSAEPSHYSALAWHRQREGETNWDILHGERLFPSGGHGNSPTEARGAALAEAMERLSTHLRGEEPLLKGRLRDLPRRAFTPPQLEHFSPSQQKVDPAESSGAGWDAVSEPWSDKQTIPWIPAWSLTQKETVYLPAAYVYYGWPSDVAMGAICTSNGVASGTSEAEAFLHGVFELVERDAVALWWYQQVPRPSAIPLTGTALPILEEARRTLAPMERDLEILDLTHDLGFPVVAALSSARGNPPWLFGFGCHLDPEKAIRKAIGEVLYQAVDLKHLPDDPFNRYHLSRPGSPLPPFCQPAPAARSCAPASGYPGPEETWDELIGWLTAHFAERDMEILALRLTRPDFGWPVVRAVIPGLHHFWPRYGSPRLYQLPPEWTGIHKAATREEELNPFPLTL